MASNQLGIKQLLEAETKAQEIVTKARKEKTALLKQAKDEADKDIAEYKTKKQKEFQDYSSKHLDGTTAIAQQLSASTAEQITKIQKEQVANGEKVIDLLLKFVSDVDTSVN